LPPKFEIKKAEKDDLKVLTEFELEFARQIERNKIFISKIQEIPNPPTYASSIL
jgi:hypothetical protein